MKIRIIQNYAITNVSYLDIIILLPVIYGIVRGVMRGIVNEAFAIVGIILGIVVARMFAGEVAEWLHTISSWNVNLLRPISAFTIFLLIAIACRLASHALTKIVKKISLAWFNRLAGGIFGAVKWILIVSIIITCVDMLDGILHFIRPDVKESSLLYPLAIRFTQSLKMMITA